MVAVKFSLGRLGLRAMNLTALQKAAAQAIINIFETGSIRGNYGDVTLLRGDTGQLTYGRSQTTLASGNLYLLIADYAARSDGAYSAAMKSYLDALEARASKLNYDMAFRGLLKDAGDDPVMHEVQDAFFDRIYWDPAMRSADALGAQSPLGAAIVYDSTVHGSWAHLRDMTRKAHGELKEIGEKDWMAAYVDTRRNWLATHPNALLHKTVYRMDAFETLLKTQNWPLALAFPIRGLVVSQEALSGADPVKVSAGGTPPRLLKLKSPPMTGADVSWLQERLARAGIEIATTGTFDAKTDQAVRAFQQNHDLKPDGVVGPVTRSALEDLSVIVPVIDVPEQPMPAVDPVVLEPYPVITPAPRESDDKPAPKPQDAHAPHDAHAPATKPTSAPHGSDDDIRSRVAAEIQAHIDDLKKSVLADPAQAPGLLSRLLANGRAYIAAILSMLTLAFTESRDLLAWTSTSGGQEAPQLHAVQGPAKDVYQSLSGARDWATETYIQLHNFAATIPNDWVFRLRVAALALIAYAVMRFARRRNPAQKAVKGAS